MTHHFQICFDDPVCSDDPNHAARVVNAFKKLIDNPGQLISFTIRKDIIEKSDFQNLHYTAAYYHEIIDLRDEKYYHDVVAPCFGFYYYKNIKALASVNAPEPLQLSFQHMSLKDVASLLKGKYVFRDLQSLQMIGLDDVYVQTLINNKIAYVLFKYCKYIEPDASESPDESKIDDAKQPMTNPVDSENEVG